MNESQLPRMDEVQITAADGTEGQIGEMSDPEADEEIGPVEHLDLTVEKEIQPLDAQESTVEEENSNRMDEQDSTVEEEIEPLDDSTPAAEQEIELWTIPLGATQEFKLGDQFNS